jgi:hypothetical protein
VLAFGTFSVQKRARLRSRADLGREETMVLTKSELVTAL